MHQLRNVVPADAAPAYALSGMLQKVMTGERQPYIAGTAMRYGDIDESAKEYFVPGSLALAETVWLNVEHNAFAVAAWHPGGGLTIRDGLVELSFEAVLPPIPLTDVINDMVRCGAGLSIEFTVAGYDMVAGYKVITDAELKGISVVGRSGYPGAVVTSARGRVGTEFSSVRFA